jgi:tRNA (cmo5U34)-methyltransferase
MYGLEDKVEHEPVVERMDEFFDARIGIYDKHMLDDLKLDGFYREIAEQVSSDRPDFRLLDLGCGTGIELGYLYDRYPEMRVTGIDLSPKMLERLREKFPDKEIALIEGSYFDVDFEGPYDVILSTYSLHHFDEEHKRALYPRIREALGAGGVFVFGDYTSPTTDEEKRVLAQRANILVDRSDDELYHLDIPLTAQTEAALMREAGFEHVDITLDGASASIIVAR